MARLLQCPRHTYISRFQGSLKPPSRSKLHGLKNGGPTDCLSHTKREYFVESKHLVMKTSLDNKMQLYKT